MAALELVPLGFVRFVFVAECSAVGYDCRDPSIGLGQYSVINPVSSGVRHQIGYYGLGLSVPGCTLDPSVA